MSFGENGLGGPVKIFIGCDPSQQLASRVLQHSIMRNTATSVQFANIDNTIMPKYHGAIHAPATSFSFARFAIPSLTSYQGRAIYLDADMLVLNDIEDLWSLPMGEAKLLLQAEPSVEELKLQSKPTVQNAVLLMDCSRLDWNPKHIIADLGVKYDRSQLMSFGFMKEKDLLRAVPTKWNALDWYDENTCLLHYTRVETQPWVYPKHKYGTPWMAELQLMLTNGRITPEFIRDQVRLGYVRPSLLVELGMNDVPSQGLGGDALMAIDMRADYQMHKADFEREQKRQLAYLKSLPPVKRLLRAISLILKRPIKFMKGKLII